jgi:hypothetical protein
VIGSNQPTRRVLLAGVLAGCASIGCLLFGSSAWANPPLRVCLEANSPPFSSESDARHGLDYEIAALVAGTLGRPLAIHWFSASTEEELPLPLQANWLLSRGSCQLVGGYPLTRDGLGDAQITELRSPGSDYPVARVRLSTVAASRPYLSLPLTLISAAGGRTGVGLDDVIGLRIAVERESLADAIAMVYGGARLLERIQRLPFGDDAIFRALESRAADYAFIEAHRFEIYRSRVPSTGLEETGYRHGLAVNTGFVGIAPELLEEVDRSLQKLGGSRRIAGVVEAYGLSYTEPGRPAILPPITPRLLARREAAN